MKATKIRMRNGCGSSNSLLEIEQIYITGCESVGYYHKDKLFDYLKLHPGSIRVNVAPYPELMPAIGTNNEKFVKSTPDHSQNDHLLNLPRE
jgi:hypothetical protein